jgi:diguanylate cyclase (GGDEF)-like protein/PAS domain S-box-containing protein
VGEPGALGGAADPARERWFRTLSATTADPVAVVDAAGRVDFASPGWDRALGLPPERVEGTHLLDHVHPEDRPWAEDALSRWASGHGGASTAEVRLIGGGGRAIPCEVAAVNLLEHDSIRGLVLTARDISYRKLAEHDLLRRAAWFQALASHSRDALIVLDEQGRPNFVSPSAETVLGWNVAALLGRPLLELFHESGREAAASELDRCLRTPGAQARVVGRARRQDGSWGDVEALAVNRVTDDAVRGVIVNLRDISENTRILEALRESEERYARAARGAYDGLWHWDLQRDRVHYSERWHEMLGLERHETSGSPDEWFERVHPEDLARLQALIAAHLDGHMPALESEHRVLHKDGTYRWVLCRGLADRDENGRALRLAGSLADISERKLFDALTGLPNRTLFMDRLGRVLERGKREPAYLFAVLVLDLDRFKVINDSMGHATGDRLLIACARRLESCLRTMDTVARLSGDEFTVLLDDLDSPDAATRIAERIQHALSQPMFLGNMEVYTSASVGIAMSRKGYDKADDVLRDADTAMHRAKSAGRARAATFETTMHIETMKVFQIETDLRRAIKREEFSVRYQPIISFRENCVAGFEALVRWQHPERGFVSPADFIPVAEESGLIAPIDRWVLKQSCQRARAWIDAKPNADQLSICVNVSSKQFSRTDLVEHIGKVLRDTGFDPRHLKLEITESAIMERPESAEAILRELKAMGVKLALDDFGTGYSSLSYLHRFPFDVLKIDRSFVARMGVEGQNPEIVKTIMALARSLQMEVVAEGVETQTQLDMLRDLDCAYAQGFFFSKPVEDGEAARLIDAGKWW